MNPRKEVQMRKLISFILFALTVLTVIITVIFCIYSIVDIQRELVRLENTPGTSGIDYLGLGWGYGIILFFVSVFGLIISAINIQVSYINIVKYISVASTLLFVLLVFASFAVFYI